MGSEASCHAVYCCVEAHMAQKQVQAYADSQQGTETLSAKVYKELHPTTTTSIRLKVGSLDETLVLTDTFIVTL